MNRRHFLEGLAALTAVPSRSGGTEDCRVIASDLSSTGSEVCNVKHYGAKGDGKTKDSSAITAAIGDLSPGALLLFPPTSSRGYYVGTDVFNLPSGCIVAGVAGVDALRRDRVAMQNPGGLVLVPDAQGLLAPRSGYLFDGGAGRIVYQPNNALAFAGNAVPGRNGGEYLIALQMRNGAYWNVRTAWSTDNLATIYVSDWVASTEQDQYDPELLLLPNGHIVCGFHNGTTSALAFYLSTDGGRLWTGRSPLAPPGNHQLWGSVKMIRTGTANRMVILFSDYDSDGQVTRYRTAYSDDEALTWSPTTTVVQATIAGTTNQINDGDHGCVFEDPTGGIQVMAPFKHDGQPGAIYHESCDTLGQSPSGTPALVTTIARISGSGESTRVGSFPHVVSLMTGEFGLYFTPHDCHIGGTTGELHFMSSPTGEKGTFAADRKVFTVTGYPSCYGFVRPSRKQDGTLELIHVGGLGNKRSQVRSVIHYGA